MTDQPQAPTPPSDIKYYSTGGGDPGVHAPKIIAHMMAEQPTCRDGCNRLSVEHARGAFLFNDQEGSWDANDAPLSSVDEFITERGYAWVDGCYVERCDECSDKWTYPWADKLDPERVAAYMREHCPDGIVELAKLKATLGPVIKPEEIATAADLQAQISPYLAALDSKIDNLAVARQMYLYPEIAGSEHGQSVKADYDPYVAQIKADYAAYVARIRANL